MPRPLNWVRGEGTFKNQRGLGEMDTENTVTLQYPPVVDMLGDSVRNSYFDWLNGGSTPVDPTGGTYTLHPSLASGGAAKSGLNLGMIVAIGVGVALVLRK